MYEGLYLCAIVQILVFVDGMHLTNQAGKDAILADISMLLPILPSNGDKLYTPTNIGSSVFDPIHFTQQEVYSDCHQLCFFVSNARLTQARELYDPSIIKIMLWSQGMKVSKGSKVAQVNCTGMAIKCFMKEVDILKEENEDDENITNIIYRIQRNIHYIWREHLQNINQENMCPQCEMYEAQHSKVFLKHLIEFLQFAHQTG